jgi:hypothetical protein
MCWSWQWQPLHCGRRYLWGAHRRGLLIALVGVVRLPVAVIGFVPILDPVLHAVSVVVALALTAAGLFFVRRSADVHRERARPGPRRPVNRRRTHGSPYDGGPVTEIRRARYRVPAGR